MKSVTTEKFRANFGKAQAATQERIRAAYQQWSKNPDHPSLRFKKVHDRLPIYSARVDLDWRAVGTMQGDTMVWFFVGPHADYEKLLSQL